MATFTDRARELTRGRSHTEGGLAKPIEEVTASIPSDAFLWLAYGAGAFALFLKARGRNHDALMAGLLVPTILIHGVYNKLVKQLGHDKYDRDED